MDIVDEIYKSDVLQRFWKNSELVEPENLIHPHQQRYVKHFFKDSAEQNQDHPRMFFLDTSYTPAKDDFYSYKQQEEIKVFAIARKRTKSN